MFCILILLLVTFDEYEFVPYSSAEIFTMTFWPYEFTGTLDQYGNFVPRSDDLPTRRPQRSRDESRALMSEILNNKKKDVVEVYEFRSGRLIPGQIRRTERRFAPDFGGTITDFTEYKYSPEARPIYNLPGKFVLKKTGGGKTTVLPAKRATTPSMQNPTKKTEASKPSDQSSALEYDFHLDLSVEYTRRFGKHLYFGKLDEYGDFVSSGTKMPENVANGMPKEAEKYVPLMSHVKQKEVYEFRFRALIPGVIENGEFVPDLGGKIIDFEEYKYSKDARPIYNLPGKFVPRDKGK